ncbi:MAG: ABC transporter permease, partial [Ruminiclostridium sp.]|nr:ABC transporter permease [Ruminiclostridium sp.]
MNILRLSLFNLRKNRKEAVATAFLTMITTLMLAIFIADSAKINSGYDDSFAASGCYHYYIGVKDEKYRDEYRTMLENSSGVHNVTEVKQLVSVATDVEKDGDILSYNLMFVTEKTEKKIENYIIRESLSDEKVKGLGHPIWLPVRFKISEGYDLGDTFTIVKYGIKYPFEIAGFYECGLVNDNGYGFKCIVSGADYALFSMILNSRAEGEFTALWFDCDYDFSINEFAERCSESSHENIEADMIFSSFTKEKENSIRFINLLLYFLAFFSVITMLSALFVTMHRINNDIEDQMQNIGALEALGYRSREISLAYVGEYLITGGIGSVLGAVVLVFVSPLMDSGVQIMMGRTVSSYADIAGTIIAAVIVTVLVIAIALLKAAKVRKYPPVTALRKGIGTHHFGRNIMPLEKSKGNINIALAAKSFIGDLRSSFGVAVCVIAASIAIFFCVNFFDFFKDGIDGLITLCGADLTVNVELMSGVDPEKVKE